MNILPKKRWHVRTKDNIARVRRDEAKAAEEEKDREKRSKLAEQEARTSLLRERARLRLAQSDDKPYQIDEVTEEEEVPPPAAAVSGEPAVVGHVNFFSDLEGGETTHADNKEREGEKKKEQEEYEKKIGLLTYLGQDTHELTGDRSWWQKIPEKRKFIGEEDGEESKEEAKKSKIKETLDPLNDIRKYLGCEGVKKYMQKSENKSKLRKIVDSKKSAESLSSTTKSKKVKKAKKKHKKKSKKKKKKNKGHSDSEDAISDFEQEEEREKAEKKKKLEKLRLERLAREKKEHQRELKILHPELVNEQEKEELAKQRLVQLESGPTKRKYNSQFNPEAARQNKLDAHKKYWLE